MFDLPESALSLRNLAWILVFSLQIQTVISGVSVTLKDEKYLDEYQQSIKGSSKVKHLAIAFYFRWGRPAARSGKIWKRGSRKSELVYNLLQVTNELQTVELSVNTTPQDPGTEDQSEVNVDAISGLEAGSAMTLKHIRFFNLSPDFDNRILTDFIVFKVCGFFL